MSGGHTELADAVSDYNLLIKNTGIIAQVALRNRRLGMTLICSQRVRNFAQPGRVVRVQGDPDFGWAQQIIGWPDPSHTNENHGFPSVSNGDGAPCPVVRM